MDASQSDYAIQCLNQYNPSFDYSLWRITMDATNEPRTVLIVERDRVIAECMTAMDAMPYIIRNYPREFKLLDLRTKERIFPQDE